MKKILPFGLAVLSTLSVIVPVAHAVTIQDPSNGRLFVTGPGTTAPEIIMWAIQLILSLTGIVAVAFLVYGGFVYMTSGGNEDNAERGKKTVTNAIIGLVIIILSYSIVTVVINALRR